MVRKILLGVASGIGLVAALVLGITVATLIATEYHLSDAMALLLLGSGALAGFITLGTMFYFVYRVSQDKQLSTEQRAIWIIALVLLWLFSAPTYWYFHVWKEARREGAETEATLPPTEIVLTGSRTMGMLARLLLGLGSCAGLVAGILSFATTILAIFLDQHNLLLLQAALATNLAGGLLLLAIIAYYVYLVYHDQQLAPEQKIMWTLILLVLAPISAPVYWYVYIWKGKL